MVIAAIISALPCPLGAQEGEPAADGGDVGALSAWEGAQDAGAAGEVNAPVDVALAGEAVEADEVEPEDLTAGGRVLITAVGDVALTTNAFKPVIDKLNHQIFAKTKAILKRGDLVFLNLESPLTSAPTVLKKTYAYTMPTERLDWLLEAGFNLFSLANNHSADAGLQGMTDTLDALEAKRREKKALFWSGIARDPKDAYKPTIIKIKGTTIAFLAVGNNSDPHVNRIYDGQVVKAIKQARSQADVVVLATHFGKEYQHIPTPAVVALYRGFVDAGADIILGTHPHVLRGIERYKGGVILHSLGNFAFSSRTVRHRETGAKMHGMVATLVIESRRVVRVEIDPLYVNNLEPWKIGSAQIPSANFVPTPVKGKFAEAVLDDLQAWSDAIAGNKVRIIRREDRGIIELK